METKNQIASFKKMVNGYKLTYLIFSADELGIFSILNEKSISLLEISKQINIEKNRIEPLLNALTFYNIISKDNFGYYLEDYKDILLKESNLNQSGYIHLAKSLIDKYKNLTLAIKNDKVSSNNFKYFTDNQARDFINGMDANAAPQVQYILDNYTFTNQKILDIGAGSGIYTISIAVNDKTVNGKLIDLEQMSKIQKERIKELNLESRLTSEVYNYNNAFPNEKYDVIFMFAIIHQEPKVNVSNLLKNAYKSLNFGGRLFLTSFFLNEDKVSPEFSVQFSIEMLINSNNGKVYTYNEINELLQEAGFNKIERVDNIPGPATLYISTK